MSVCDCLLLSRARTLQADPNPPGAFVVFLAGAPSAGTGSEKERCMYRVTMRMGSDREMTLRVPNQDLARTLSLAARLEFLNPGLHVSYQAEPRALADDAA